MDAHSQPSFYAIIPAFVRYCKEIEPGAKLLYGELTALATQHGYCWASNRYLASLYDVDQKTVSRWIKSLRDQGFIETEVEMGGFQTIRKIWICPENKKICTSRQNCQEGQEVAVTPDDKNVLHINTSSITAIKEEKERAPPPNPPPPPEKIETFFESGKVKMKSEALASLISDFGDSKVKEMIGRLNEYAEIKPKKFKEYGNHAMVIRKWIREDLDKGGSKPAIQSRAEDLAMKVEEAFPNHPHIRYGRGYIEFISGQGSTHVKFTDANSDGIIESFLRKMNIWGRIGKL